MTRLLPVLVGSSASLLASCLSELPPPDERYPAPDGPVTVPYVVDVVGALDAGRPEECRFELVIAPEYYQIGGWEVHDFILEEVTFTLAAPLRYDLQSFAVELRSPSMSAGQWVSMLVELVAIDTDADTEPDTSVASETLTEQTSPTLFLGGDPVGTWLLRIVDADARAGADLQVGSSVRGTWVGLSD